MVIKSQIIILTEIINIIKQLLRALCQTTERDTRTSDEALHICTNFIKNTEHKAHYKHCSKGNLNVT